MDGINDMFVVDTSNDTSYSFDTGVVTAGAYKAVFILSNDNVYLLGSQQADVLKIDTINDSLSIAGVISDNEQYIVAMVVNDKVYAPSENQNEPILKLTFESATVVKPGKYFPIVIETEETVLEDKFTPETIFRVKFRMANRRKGLK
jgi:hypothetical protein